MKIAAALSLVRQNARPVLILAAALVLPACASMKAKSAKSAKGTNGKLFAVSSSTASFYRYGPQQGNGPDESLPKDTLMTLIRPSFGYCKVQLVGNSKEGYVASEDIKPATPTLIASLNPPAPVSTTSARENFDVRTFEPPPSDTLPAPDLPPAAPEASPQ